MKETQLIKQILDYCRYRNLLFWRNQSGAVVTDSGHLMKFGMSGSPDIVGCYKGKFIGVECKVGKNKQTQLQKDFGDAIMANGGEYWLIYNFEEFVNRFISNKETVC